jgi:hypothetical protein
MGDTRGDDELDDQPAGGARKQEPTLELPSLFGRRRKKRQAEPRAETAPEPVPEPVPEPEPEPAQAVQPRRRAKRADKPARTGPVVAPPVAAALVGLVVGAAGTALTWASLAGCEMLRGTESCGGSGLLVLVAILVLMVLAGALLLKALRIADNSSTSFLGTGLMTVVVLVTLMENLFSAWMFVVVPMVCAVSFAIAQWVTTRFVASEDSGPGVDVR